jgi:hypothetical protein
VPGQADRAAAAARPRPGEPPADLDGRRQGWAGDRPGGRVSPSRPDRGRGGSTALRACLRARRRTEPGQGALARPWRSQPARSPQAAVCRKAAPARSAAHCRHPARQGQPCRSPGERPARVAMAGPTVALADPAGRRRTPTREGVQCLPGRARRPGPGRDRSPRVRGLAAWRPPKRRWGRSYPQQRRGCRLVRDRAGTG